MITFDKHNVCNFCRDHEKIKYSGDDALRQKMASIPKGNGVVDCVVPVSGGKDSTYVLYYVTKVLGLKAIAVNYDNGLTHHHAKENLRRITDTLGVELVTISMHKQKSYLAKNLKAYFAKPNPAMVPTLCTGCRIGIVGNVCKVAQEKGIRMVFFGWSAFEEAPFKAGFLKADGGSVVTGLIVNIISNPKYLLNGTLKVQILDYLHSYTRVRDWGVLLKKLYPGIYPIPFFDYIEYNPGRIQQEVSEKVGWSAPDPENSWRFDCQIKLLQDRIYLNEVGFNATHDYLSAKIREKYITRDDAMGIVSKYGCNDKEFERIKSILVEIGAEDLALHFKALKDVHMSSEGAIEPSASTPDSIH